MSGDAEFNVDNLIARLLEGEIMKKKKIEKLSFFSFL
jgi:hypothetical protein